MTNVVVTLALLVVLSGCASKAHWLDGVTCQDPAPLHPNVMIGSTPCERK